MTYTFDENSPGLAQRLEAEKVPDVSPAEPEKQSCDWYGRLFLNITNSLAFIYVILTLGIQGVCLKQSTWLEFMFKPAGTTM